MQSRASSLCALIGGAILIGLVPIGVRWSSEWGGLGSLATGFWRFALAAAPLLAWQGWQVMRRRDGNLEPARAEPIVVMPWRPGILIVCGLAFAADIGCYFVAIGLTSVANATLLSNFAPIVVVGFTVWILRRPVAWMGWLGAVVAFVGVGLLARRSLAETSVLTGDALGLLSAVFYGLYQLAIAHARRDQPALRVMTAVAVVGAVALAGPAFLLEDVHVPTQAWGWGVLIGLAWITQIGGQGLITWSLAHLPASFSSVVLLIQPVVAAILGWLLFAESLGAWQLLGAALVLSGIVLARNALSASPRP